MLRIVYHEGFIEEVTKSLCEVLDESIWIPEDIQTEEENVSLLNGL